MEAFASWVQEIAKVERSLLWIAILLCSVLIFILSKGKRTNIPGPVGLPILGYLPFLGQQAHLTLYELSKKYGNIFGLYLGRAYVVVVTDYNTAKELYNKPTVQDRPPDSFYLVPDGFGFATANGEEWVEQRRHTVRQMKTIGLVGSEWDKNVQCEVVDFLELLEQANGEPIDIDKPLSASVSNNVLALISGHRLPMGDPGREILDDGIESFELIYAPSSFINYFPTFYKIAIKFGLLKVAPRLKAVEKLNKFVKQIIEECKRKGDNSYINHYLKEMENRKKQDSRHFFNARNLIGNSQALIIAGSDTTKVSLTWLLFAMAAHPDVQDKVQKELDAVLSDGQIISWDERNKLPYCQATMYEGQRWRTSAPMNVLHGVTEDTEIQGYVIPKNTAVIAMTWAFHNDPKYWKDPEKFQPERFLTDDGKGVKKCDSFEPFSMGRRRCPGETAGLIEVFIYFTAILHKFRILPAKEGKSLDLTGFLGLVYHPKPQPLRYVPRTTRGS